MMAPQPANKCRIRLDPPMLHLLLLVSVSLAGFELVSAAQPASCKGGGCQASGVYSNYSATELQALANKWKLSPAQAAALGRPQDAGKIRICISPYSPQVYCEAGKPQESFTGYQVQVFREVAQRVTWLANFDGWFFDCMAWTPMMDDLLAENGTCMMSPSGIAATQERIDKGLRVSWVIDKEGYRIMTVPTKLELNLWTPFTVFSAPLWVLLFCTSIFVGVILWLVDTRARSLLKPPPKSSNNRKRGRKTLTGILHGVHPVPAQPCSPEDKQQLPTQQTEAGLSSLSSSGSTSNAPSVCCRCNGDLASADASVNGCSVAVEAEKQLWQGQQLQHPAKEARQQQHQQPPQNGRSQHEADPREVRLYLSQQKERSDSLLRWLGVRKGEERQAIKHLKANMTQSFLRMPDIGEPPSVQSLPAKIFLFSYGLLLLIIIALYTASAAAQLTAQSLKSDIRSIDDLKGKAVVTWDGYADKLQEQGLPTIRMPWETNKDEEKMLSMVVSGQAKALILGATFADLIVNERCEWAAVGNEWNTMDSGIGYSVRMPIPLQDSLNREIQAAIEQGSVERMYNIYIRKQGGHCANSAAQDSGEVGLQQVAGLWVLLALSLSVAIAILGFYYIRRYKKHMHMLAASATQQLRSVSFGGLGGSHARLASWLSRAPSTLAAARTRLKRGRTTTAAATASVSQADGDAAAPATVAEV